MERVKSDYSTLFTGFKTGSLTLDDVDERSAENTVSGNLPKGEYSKVCTIVS